MSWFNDLSFYLKKPEKREEIKSKVEGNNKTRAEIKEIENREIENIFLKQQILILWKKKPIKWTRLSSDQSRKQKEDAKLPIPGVKKVTSTDFIDING